MTFDEKLQTFFSRINILLPNKHTRKLVHLYADYVEVISLFSNDNFISTSDVEDRFYDEGILHKSKTADKNQAEANDETEKWINEIFAEIKNREFSFGIDYPFIVENSDKIRLKDPANINNRNKLYLFMLLASNLDIFNIFQPELTTDFEILSYESLNGFMPNPSIVKSFGKNSEYIGTAQQKIKLLANDIKVSINEETLSEISELGNQERGLDLVAWIPFEDSIANKLLVLCQCACGKEWFKKLSETGRYENYFDLHRNKPVHAMFVPYSLLDIQKSRFHQSNEILNTLIFERKRILNFIQDDSFFNAYPSKQVVDRCIIAEEDIV